MAFQVKEFDSIQIGNAIDWKFKLTNKTTSEFNFYDVDEASRSLLDLSKDISGQFDIQIQNKKKKGEQKNRIIRKACEKTIKSLRLSLTSFSDDIGEPLNTVKGFFKKQKISQPTYSTIMQKCKRWTLSAWLSLDADNFFKTTQKYIESYQKDSKKINQDFELFTQLYGVIIGQKNSQSIYEDQSEPSNLIQIDINLKIEGIFISECLLYSTENLSYIKCRNFSEHFLSDILKQNNIEGLQKQSIQQFEQQIRVQIRSQCMYKTLLQKYAHTLLNFSTIQIPSQVKEYLIPIVIKLKNQMGEEIYEDYFEWDILNENNNIEQFCEQLIKDAELDERYFSQLCYIIRSAINTELEWKFSLLVKTFKSIHKDRQQPKLNTQTTQIIRKNLPYTMDVLMLPENQAYKPSNNIIFANSDVFSLLTRNYDILPEEFQNFLNEKQQRDNPQIVRENSKHADDILTGIQKPHAQQLTSSSNKIHPVSSKSSVRPAFQVPSLEMSIQKGIKLQTNTYLSGINKIDCSNIWRKLMMQEKTTAQ